MIGADIYHNLKEKYNLKSILFCPYKEEMFDSMKTVYEEALKDKEVEVCLMPIPYYNLYHLMPVGLSLEFGKQNFPEALNRRWDVIIFHYPYDTKNSITRPLITSAVLKCFCQHLVLISYSVVGGRELREQECLLSGAMNSDLIVLENEVQRESMLKVHEKYGVKDIEVVAWGHPKYDIREAEIPKEWAEKANGRKVILLQNSIVPYMNDVDKLKKIEKFVDSHNECILWRPHPLYVDTIKSIRPYELPIFQRIMEKVDIFDTTADYVNAFEFCDEMVSDGSSLDILFKRTGKPIIPFEIK